MQGLRVEEKDSGPPTGIRQSSKTTTPRAPTLRKGTDRALVFTSVTQGSGNKRGIGG